MSLNVGVKNSSGQILIFTDSDSVLGRSSIRLLVERLLRDRDVGAVAGYLKVAEGKKNLLAHFQSIEYKLGQDQDKFLQSTSGSVLVCPGPLFAVRRDLALEFPFSEKSIVEDADMTVRWLKGGMKVCMVRDAVVYTSVPSSLKAWVSQRKRWWMGFLQLWKAHRRWATRNSWMLFNYSAYVVGVASMVLLLLLPVLLMQYSSPVLQVERGFPFALAPVALFLLLYAPYFTKEKKMMPILPLYCTVYYLMKMVVLARLYLAHLLGIGVKVKFGSKEIRVK